MFGSSTSCSGVRSRAENWSEAQVREFVASSKSANPHLSKAVGVPEATTQNSSAVVWLGTLIGRCAPGAACAYGIALGLIIVIRAVRSASATAIAFVASFAVLRFEPHTTMPPSNAATAAAIAPRSNRITPKNIAKGTTPPPHVAIRETRMNLRQPRS